MICNLSWKIIYLLWILILMDNYIMDPWKGSFFRFQKYNSNIIGNCHHMCIKVAISF